MWGNDAEILRLFLLPTSAQIRTYNLSLVLNVLFTYRAVIMVWFTDDNEVTLYHYISVHQPSDEISSALDSHHTCSSVSK